MQIQAHCQARQLSDCHGSHAAMPLCVAYRSSCPVQADWPTLPRSRWLNSASGPKTAPEFWAAIVAILRVPLPLATCAVYAVAHPCVCRHFPRYDQLLRHLSHIQRWRRDLPPLLDPGIARHHRPPPLHPAAHVQQPQSQRMDLHAQVRYRNAS